MDLSLAVTVVSTQAVINRRDRYRTVDLPLPLRV